MSTWIKKVYSIYALVLFALLLLIALIPYTLVRIFVPDVHQIRGVYMINSAVMHIWSPLTGYRYKILNPEIPQKNESYILVLNHYSILDMFTVAHNLKVAGKPLIKRELLRIPILGWIFSMAGIPVNRSSSESRVKSFRAMEAQAKKGISILIFAEGTRNRTDQPLNAFKDGAFRLAAATGKKILPVVLLNLRDKSHPDSIFFSPGRVLMQYLEPIDPADHDNDPGRIKSDCRESMRTAILKNDPFFQTK